MTLSQSNESSFSFLRKWIPLNILGCILGVGITLGITGLIGLFVSGNKHEGEAIGNTLLAPILGFTIALMQLIMLRKRLSVRFAWALAGAVGFAIPTVLVIIAELAGLVGHFDPWFVGSVLVGGLTTAWIQSILLRSSSPHPMRWLVFSVFAWAVAVLIAVIVSTLHLGAIAVIASPIAFGYLTGRGVLTVMQPAIAVQSA